MKQLPSDKYNVAWFKLAEFVTRGEKERALAMYRLLSHSLGDPALSLQLEGDLLMSFGDEDAEKKYSRAVSLYKRDERTIEAVSVYEHLIEISPDCEGYLLSLVDLYMKLGWGNKASVVAQRFIRRLCRAERQTEALRLLRDLEKDVPGLDLTSSRKTIVLTNIASGHYDLAEAIKMAERVVETLTEQDNRKAVSEFLSELSALDDSFVRRLGD